MSNQLPGRIHELFFYAHQQLLRRYVDFCKRIISYEDLFFRAKIERKILGLEDIVSLTPEELKKPLGPGYKAGKWRLCVSDILRVSFTGWYSWEGLGGRIDDCDLTKLNPDVIKREEDTDVEYNIVNLRKLNLCF